MKNIYNNILKARSNGDKLLAILLDPDKLIWANISELILKINQSPATHIFVGGSKVETNCLDEIVLEIVHHCRLPVLIFPGDASQISKNADGILFLSLISGRNPDYLIENQVRAVPILRGMNLEIISTGYILIESGRETAVSRVSQTKPLCRKNIDYVVQTAQAGILLGNKLLYLEAGSGADQAVPLEMIQQVVANVEVPVIVGGGIRSYKAIQAAHDAGADLVVIGTAFENDVNFFLN
jgi:phosphoglycerol geranylgeranyltransferase